MPLRPLILSALPLQYLLAVGLADMLPRLYSPVILPYEAWEALGFPTLDGIEIRRDINVTGLDLQLPEAPLGSLQAIACALSLFGEAPLLLLEPRAPRAAAAGLQIDATGVVGILLWAKREGELSTLRNHLFALRAAHMPLTGKAILGALLLAGENP